MTDERQELLASVRECAPLSVAAACGALGLILANADHGDRLVPLALAALEEPGGGRPPSRTDLERWLAPDAPALGPQWDPHEAPVVAPVTFFEPGRVIFTGGGPHVAHVLNVLLPAIFLGSEKLEEAYTDSALQLVHAMLNLTTALADATGIRRYEPAGPRPARPLISPSGELARLMDMVNLDATGLGALCRTDIGYLDPLTHDLDAAPLPEAPTGTPFELRPIVRAGGRYVIPEPAAFGVALRHALVTMAIDAGLRDELRRRFRDVSVQTAAQSAELMDWTFVEAFERQDAPITSLVYAFDSDKAAHVAVLTDDLEGYSRTDPYAPWQASRWSDEVAESFKAAEEHVFYRRRGPNEIFHLVVMAGLGRGSFFGLTEPALPVQAAQKLVSSEGFETMALSALDALDLYKCARAGERLRRGAQVFAFDSLDEFQAWKEFGDSFYFGDDGRPTMVQFDPSYGRARREKVGAATDVHSVEAPEGGVLEVVRVHAEPSIPIYAPLRTLGNKPRLFVEAVDPGIWLIPSEDYEREHRSAFGQVIDCLAYWVWQVAPSLPDVSCIGADVIVVEVALDEPDLWLAGQAPRRGQGPLVTVDALEDLIRFSIHPELTGALDGADNRGEREMLRALLEGIDQLIVQAGGDPLGPEAITLAVERHAPLGPKKKISRLNAEADIALWPGNLPPRRLIQEADTDEVLDEVGPQLADQLGLEIGPLDGRERTRALHTVVELHYEQLRDLVETLSPDGLLETLVLAHEAMLRHDAQQRATAGARIAAYGETKLIDDLTREMPKTAQTFVSLRFVIEYVTAQPPRGLRPMSLALFDRLLAIAGQIVSRGRTSDVIHYGLEDTQLSMLASGRLGLSEEGPYHTGQHAFLAAIAPAHARAAGARYARQWEQRDPQLPDYTAELDDATRAEWGLTMTQLLQFFWELTLAARERDADVGVATRGTLAAELARGLNWAIGDVEMAMDLLTLNPRSDFVTVPTGFSTGDLWPWRFNRELSYLRRPLLARETANGAEIVWGLRHAEAAAHYLLMLISGERLKARSTQMKQLMTRLRQEEATEFVESVAQLHRDAGMMVKTNVKKVGGARIQRSNGDDLTDIDVLAADPESKTLYVRECKDLEGARTPAELHNELTKTFGSGGKRPSAAEKHVERVAWLTARLAAALADLGITDDADRWSIDASIVTDVQSMSPYVRECVLPVVPMRLLKNLLGASH